MEHLDKPQSIILALGGVRAVADLAGAKTATVYSWSQRGRFPSKTYIALRDALNERGYDPDPRLWRMTRLGSQEVS